MWGLARTARREVQARVVCIDAACVPAVCVPGEPELAWRGAAGARVPRVCRTEVVGASARAMLDATHAMRELCAGRATIDQPIANDKSDWLSRSSLDQSERAPYTHPTRYAVIYDELWVGLTLVRWIAHP